MSKLVLAVDPGKATGVAFFRLTDGEDPEVLFTSEPQPEQFASEIRNALSYSQDFPDEQLIVVCERFVINAQTVRNSQAPYSLEQIGVLKQCLRDVQIDENSIVWQTPADAKAMFPNPALKKVGYWHKGGEGHALDAIRHGLLAMVRRGWKPSRLLS